MTDRAQMGPTPVRPQLTVMLSLIAVLTGDRLNSPEIAAMCVLIAVLVVWYPEIGAVVSADD